MSHSAAKEAGLLESSKLIEELKSQIAVMKEEIGRAQQERESSVAKLTSDLNETEGRLIRSLHEEIFVLRQQYQAKVKVFNDSLVENTRHAYARLQETQRRLEIEHFSLSNMRKVPPEIMLEIFEWRLQGATPTRNFALVCKAWKRFLLDTPSLWRKLRAHVVDHNRIDWCIRQLLRRIELSKTALLEVEMSLSAYHEGSRLDLFHIVLQTSKDRWRSLKLEFHSSTYNMQPFEPYLYEGSFKSLKTLDLKRYTGKISLFDNLIAAVSRSKATLKHLLLPRSGVSLDLCRSPILHHITNLRASQEVLNSLSHLTHIQQLFILWIDEKNNKVIDLPKITRIDDVVSLKDLCNMRLHAVESLEIDSLILFQTYGFPAPPTSPIEMPQLTSLKLSCDGFRSLRYLHTPRLNTLSLYNYMWEENEAEERNQEALEYFQAAQNGEFAIPHPIILRMDLSLSSTALLAALQYWSKLQELTLIFGDELDWADSLASALSRSENLLCPELVTLRLCPRDEAEEDWKEVAERILEARKGTSLRTIIWKREDDMDMIER